MVKAAQMLGNENETFFDFFDLAVKKFCGSSIDFPPGGPGPGGRVSRQAGISGNSRNRMKNPPSSGDSQPMIKRYIPSRSVTLNLVWLCSKKEKAP
jgi:hypothetical protein